MTHAILKQMIRAGDNGYLDSDAIAQYQVEATLELAEQVKRIADLLGSYGVEYENARGETLRVLGVGNVEGR